MQDRCGGCGGGIRSSRKWTELALAGPGPPCISQEVLVPICQVSLMHIWPFGSLDEGKTSAHTQFSCPVPMRCLAFGSSVPAASLLTMLRSEQNGQWVTPDFSVRFPWGMAVLCWVPWFFPTADQALWFISKMSPKVS